MPPPVSIVIPARNDEALLPAALASVLGQDYAGTIEVVVADGSDTAATAAVVAERFPAVRVVPNPERNAAAGLNRAVRAASHAVIVRCDARCELPSGYVRQAVAVLERTGAATVGGRQCPAGRTAFERAVALALSTPLGAGDARWRIGGAAGPADTVYLGTFRRAALEAVGGFDASLARNQDYELNWRLRQRGETVWFDPSLAVAYRPRGSLGALARQYYDYGWWKRVMLQAPPRGPQVAATGAAAAGGGTGGVAGARGGGRRRGSCPPRCRRRPGRRGRRRAARLAPPARGGRGAGGPAPPQPGGGMDAAGARGDAPVVGDGIPAVRPGRRARGMAPPARARAGRGGSGSGRMTRRPVPAAALRTGTRQPRRAAWRAGAGGRPPAGSGGVNGSMAGASSRDRAAWRRAAAPYSG